MSEKTHSATALLLIDVQVDLFHKSHPIYHADMLLENLRSLIQNAHIAGAPVIYLQHANKQLVKGTSGWQIHPSVSPAAADLVFDKTHGSAFIDTPLHAHLAEQGVDTLVVAGLVTHGCVRATCLDALQHGYRVILAEDGHSSYSKDAAQLVDEWNVKLAGLGVLPMPSREIQFG